MGGPPPPFGGPPMPGMGMGMAPPIINLIKLNKPELKSAKKIKAFVWKRVILDRQGGSNDVASNDLRGPDPNWKGKIVVWKDIKEDKNITLELIEELFSDKTKKAPVKVMDSGKVDLNKPKTFFDSNKGQNLFIVLSRLPKAETLLIALDNLNEKTVSTDNL
jgi:hypothetical protein